MVGIFFEGSFSLIRMVEGDFFYCGLWMVFFLGMKVAD